MPRQLLFMTALIGAVTTSIQAQTTSDFFNEQEVSTMIGNANENFGDAVSISGDLAIVGARKHTTSGIYNGSAYVFQLNNGSWVETAELISSDNASYDYFGRAASISGTTLVVGADGDDDSGSNSGSAYIFEQQPNGSWLETAKLIASDGAPSDYFGTKVNISGTIVVVGAQGDDDNGSMAGSAYIFEQQIDGSWLETAKLLASDGAAFDYFGGSVSIFGTTVVIGAYGDDDNGLSSGSAYIFEQQIDGSWLETAKLLASDGSTPDSFGASSSLSGTTAVIGAYNSASATGSVYIFEQQPDGSWLENAKVLASNGVANDQFGIRVGISGTSVIVGSPYHDIPSTDQGSAYFYTLGNTIINLETSVPYSDLTTATVEALDYDRLAVLSKAFNTSFLHLDLKPINFIGAQPLSLSDSLTLSLSDNTSFTFTDEVLVANRTLSLNSLLYMPANGRITIDGSFIGIGTSTLFLENTTLLANPSISTTVNSIAYLSGTLLAPTVSTSDTATNYIYQNTMVLGDYLNDATTIVQHGILSITGTLTNNGTLLGAVDTGPPPFRGAPRMVPPVPGDGMSIGGDYTLGTAASLHMLDFDWTLRVGGNFDCAINDNSNFSMIGSTLAMSGFNQSFELMSLDVGADVLGLDPLIAGHFPIGTFKVSSGSSVDLVDVHDNALDGMLACETLYVDTLIVEAGATLTTNGCPVYAVNSVIDGVVIGDVTPIGDTGGCAGDVNGDGLVNVSDILIIIAEWGCSGSCIADTNGDSIVNVSDLLQVIADFGGAC